MGYKDVFYRKLFMLLAVIGLIAELFGVVFNFQKVIYFGFFFMSPFFILTLYVLLMELDMQAGADECKKHQLKKQTDKLQ